MIKEKASLDGQEKRMNNLASKLSIMEVELRSKFSDVQEAKDDISRIDNVRENLTQVSVNFEEKIEALNKENVRLGS